MTSYFWSGFPSLSVLAPARDVWTTAYWRGLRVPAHTQAYARTRTNSCAIPRPPFPTAPPSPTNFAATFLSVLYAYPTMFARDFLFQPHLTTWCIRITPVHLIVNSPLSFEYSIYHRILRKSHTNHMTASNSIKSRVMNAWTIINENT